MKLFLKIFFSILCIFALFYWIKPQQLVLKFTGLQWLPLGMAFVLNFIFLAINSQKICLLFPPPGPRFGNVFKINLMAVFFRFFLFGGISGDVARWNYLSEEPHSISQSRTFSVLLLDRITGLWTQLFFTLIAGLWIYRHVQGWWYYTLFGSVLVLVLIVLSLFCYRGLAQGGRKLTNWYLRFLGKAQSQDPTPYVGLNQIYTSPHQIFKVILLSVLSQFSIVMLFILIDQSIGYHFNWAQATLFLFFYTFLQILPITFGNWGVTEGAVGLIFHYLGSETETGILFSILIRAMNIPAALWGWWVFLVRKSQPK